MCRPWCHTLKERESQVSYIPFRKQTGRKDKESNKKIKDQRLKSPGRRRKVYSIYLWLFTYLAADLRPSFRRGGWNFTRDAPAVTCVLLCLVKFGPYIIFDVFPSPYTSSAPQGLNKFQKRNQCGCVSLTRLFREWPWVIARQIFGTDCRWYPFRIVSTMTPSSGVIISLSI